MKIKHVTIWTVLAGAILLESGCVAYPRIFMTGKTGKANVEEGRTPVIRAQIIKKCVSETGESEEVTKTKDVPAEKDGSYSFTIFAVNWNRINFINGNECISRLQLFICRDICRPTDEVDINILGK